MSRFRIANCGLRNSYRVGRKGINMNNQDLKDRSKKFALAVMQLVERLPNEQTCRVLGKQLLRSGTSVAANYRAACRGKSTADYISKMGIVEEEADESHGWMELIVDSGKRSRAEVSSLLKEADELTAIAVASIRTARKNQNP